MGFVDRVGGPTAPVTQVLATKRSEPYKTQMVEDRSSTCCCACTSTREGESTVARDELDRLSELVVAPLKTEHVSILCRAAMGRRLS